MSRYEPTERTKAKRLPKRAAYDAETVHAILDGGMVAHVGFIHDGQPYVLPMIYGRKGAALYLHGSAAGRALRALKGGAPLCVTVTLLDGLVMARSAFHHSMNYRCVVVLGAARPVEGREEKLEALRVISDQLFPGRWDDARKPNEAELKQTLVVALELKECSAKTRTGPPLDEEEDYALPVWAGVIPTTLSFGAPAPDKRLTAGVPYPRYLAERFGEPRK